MPLPLPDGLYATALPGDETALLGGTRVTSFRYELLDRDERFLGVLDSVAHGGSLSWSAQASIKSGGTIPVTDPGRDIDWVHTRVRPVVLLSSGDTATLREVTLGVYLPAAPSEDWSDEGRSWSVDLLDKATILDQDVPTDSMGNATAYTAPAGSNVLALVAGLIQSSGEPTPALQPGSEVLQSALVFEPGTTKLKIVNELLDAANYFSLWVDGEGQFQATKYRAPQDRGVTYEMSAPFSRGSRSLMAPDWTRERDVWTVPNRYVAVSQGDGEEEGLVATATNVDPSSPYSYPSRGRWVTQVEEGVEATSLASLQAHAQRRLLAAAGVSSKIEVHHAYLPDLLVNSTIRFQYEQGLSSLDMLCTVQNTQVPLDPTALCKSTLREVIG